MARRGFVEIRPRVPEENVDRCPSSCFLMVLASLVLRSESLLSSIESRSSPVVVEVRSAASTPKTERTIIRGSLELLSWKSRRHDASNCPRTLSSPWPCCNRCN